MHPQDITAVIAIIGLSLTIVASAATLYARLELLRNAVDAFRKQFEESGTRTQDAIKDHETRLRRLEDSIHRSALFERTHQP